MEATVEATVEPVVEPVVAVSSWFDAGLRLTPEAVEPEAVAEPAVDAVVPASDCYDDAGLRHLVNATTTGLRRLPRQRVAHRPPGRLEAATEPATIEPAAIEPAVAPTIEAATEVAEPAKVAEPVQVVEPTVEVATSEESAESWISCGRDAHGVRLAPPQAPATEAAPEARDLLSPPAPPPKWQHVEADKHGFHHW